jgi:hypothetical protein
LTAKILFKYPSIEKLEHRDADLWHNSWVLPAGSVSLAIIYLPQYLEFIGFAIIGVFILTLIIKIIFTKHGKS